MTKHLLTIATWNVNSLPVRSVQVLDWMSQHNIDVLAVQETYNGVAIISRFPLEDVLIEPQEVLERRVIAATIQGVRIINLYVPNGSEVGSDKYTYKLKWLEDITLFIETQKQQYPLIAVVGDFNIAPEDIDVYDPSEWCNCVLVSPKERDAFSKILDLGLYDSFRHKHPQTKEFSWWDYRAASFRRQRGLRIDHILLSKALYTLCQTVEIDQAPRKHERPSDHAPVWSTLTRP